MLTITAVIRVKSGREGVMRQALLDVAEHVRRNEPGTLGYFVSQGGDDPCVFATHERFVDRASMDAHNASAAVTQFFRIAEPILDGDVVVVTADELASKP